jgi:hypothetical protein
MPLILFAIFAVLAVYVAPPVIAAVLTVLWWAFTAVASVVGLVSALLGLVPGWCVIALLAAGIFAAIFTATRAPRPKKVAEPFFVRRTEPLFTWSKEQD